MQALGNICPRARQADWTQHKLGRIARPAEGNGVKTKSLSPMTRSSTWQTARLARPLSLLLAYVFSTESYMLPQRNANLSWTSLLVLLVLGLTKSLQIFVDWETCFIGNARSNAPRISTHGWSLCLASLSCNGKPLPPQPRSALTRSPRSMCPAGFLSKN